MTTQAVISIDAFKHLPCHSSSNAEKIGHEAEMMVVAAKEQYDIIHGYTDMQTLISAAGMDKCWDALAAIRQLAAALFEVGDHFSATHMHDSLQTVHGRIQELLRKAEREVKHLVTFVER